tara:strand:+ start:1509 stop:2210 length:702 start_codon:yes stop_codon:yes gene_type:complete
MENKGRITELITDSDNGKSFAIVSIVLLIGFSFHGFTFIVSIDDEIRAKYAESEFKIQFFEEMLDGDDSIIVGDGNTETITLSRENIGISSTKMIAKLEFTITYSETSGEFGDPCDEVRVEIPPNGMVADWQNENNMLSNSTDDCESMSLLVYIYPHYDGIDKNVSGYDMEYWQDSWSNETYGSGELNLRISVDTNRPATSFAPTIDDSDEEININWRFTIFEFGIEDVSIIQ